MRVHLDTDFAGDTDDACALAMLLGWPGVELVGITTTADPDGSRAGYVSLLLELAGRDDIPVATGAGTSLTTGKTMGDLPDHDTYWPRPVAPRPGPIDRAIDLIAQSAEAEATVVAIGPYTNLALAEMERPGTLNRAPVVVMGGCVQPAGDGLPAWGPEMDWNVLCDTRAAMTVAACSDLTLVTLPVTLKAHLRVAHLDRLSASGPIGRLLARQGVAHGTEHSMARLGQSHAGLPDDLLNFQYDPLACAVAVGWNGAVVDEMRLTPVLEGDLLRFDSEDDGHPTRVVVDIDGADFAETWLSAVEAADRRST